MVGAGKTTELWRPPQFPIFLVRHHGFDLGNSVTRKKSPNVYKSCPKMISLQKRIILTPLQKLPKNVDNLGKLIAAKGFKKLPKVQ